MIPAELASWKDRLGYALAEPARELAPKFVAPRRRMIRPRTLVTAAAAAVALVLVLALSPAHHTPSPTVASAAAALSRVSDAAGRMRALGTHDYAYVKLAYRLDTTSHQQGIEEQWIRRDGSGIRITRSGGATTRERLARSAAPFVVGGQRVSYSDMVALGRSPARLARFVTRATLMQFPGRTSEQFSIGQRHAYGAYTVLRDLLLAPAPPDLRRALYRQLSTASGLRLAHASRDRVTVSSTIGAVRFEMTLDARTGALLALRRSLLQRSWQVPGPARVLSEARILGEGVVAHLRERP
jgi:hypothetical protein